jgi:predicted nucleic acid-binding protein
VVSASAAVEALIGTPLGRAVRAQMRGCELHSPAHLDAEVLSALGRLNRAGALRAKSVISALSEVAAARSRDTISLGCLRVPGPPGNGCVSWTLCTSSWTNSLEATLLTTDARLARQSATAELVAEPSSGWPTAAPARTRSHLQ